MALKAAEEAPQILDLLLDCHGRYRGAVWCACGRGYVFEEFA
jgi:hypothetical protein